MKKITALFMSLALLLGMTACGSKPAASSQPSSEPTVSSKPSAENSQSPSPAPTETPDASAEIGKTLVVYFSLPETTDPDNMTQEEDNSVVVIAGEVLGNTQYVAYVIQENTGTDIFRIEPKTPYTTNHEDLVDVAKEEQNNNVRPELAANVENLDQYDTIFIGYPNWWGDMPMILYSFFDSNDFSGKTIIPFNTHGGSGFSNTIGTIADLEPDATVNESGFTVSRNNVQEAEPDIISWLSAMLEAYTMGKSV